jgi:hypothetical protein
MIVTMCHFMHILQANINTINIRKVYRAIVEWSYDRVTPSPLDSSLLGSRIRGGASERRVVKVAERGEERTVVAGVELGFGACRVGGSPPNIEEVKGTGAG